MSAVIETFLICDGNCGRNFGVDNRHETAAQHRESAKQAGWRYVNGKDFCPECFPKAEKRKKSIPKWLAEIKSSTTL